VLKTDYELEIPYCWYECQQGQLNFRKIQSENRPISLCRRHYGSKVNRSKKRHCICKHIETNLFIVVVMRISSL